MNSKILKINHVPTAPTSTGDYYYRYFSVMFLGIALGPKLTVQFWCPAQEKRPAQARWAGHSTSPMVTK